MDMLHSFAVQIALTHSVSFFKCSRAQPPAMGLPSRCLATGTKLRDVGQKWTLRRSELWKQVTMHQALGIVSGTVQRSPCDGVQDSPSSRLPMTSAVGHQGGTTWKAETDLSPAISGEIGRGRILYVGTRGKRWLKLQCQLDNDVHCVIATGPADGLALLEAEVAFDVIITMLESVGSEQRAFTAKLREHSPDAERLILSRRIDARVRAAVATDARVMRLLVHPCPASVIREAVADALLRHRARCLRAAMVPRMTPPGGNPCAG